MEGKPGDRMSLLAYLRRSSAQLDHWVGDETGFFHDSVEEGEEILGGEDYRELRSLEALPAWRARTRPADPDEVCLIDGRMRVLARLLVGKEVLLLAETAAGHVRWCREGGLSMGFSQRRPPRLRRIVAADKSVVDRLAEAGSDICFGERLIFSLAGSGKTTAVSSSGEAAYQAVCNVMRTLEAEEVRSLIDGGIPVIMDGTVHRGDPPFRSMVGPCGLVKR
ncbi:MAG TPA: hypothetical protein VLH40_07875, partial [Atribacteraceae bacterium]|nr:hypothetical protein [Atribacteraceae bacterium]